MAFMQGSNILEGVLILHKVIREMHQKKVWSILEVDIEKASIK
jgi:hypothetical protein